MVPAVMSTDRKNVRKQSLLDQKNKLVNIEDGNENNTGIEIMEKKEDTQPKIKAFDDF